MSPRTKGSSMSAEHKAALAEGRRQGNSVRRYLDALDANKPKRGRKRTPESVSARLATVTDAIGSAAGVDRLELIQERLDLQTELESMQKAVDISDLEDEFVKVAAAYGDRKGISYSAWREVGVPAPTLKRAGIGRGAG